MKQEHKAEILRRIARKRSAGEDVVKYVIGLPQEWRPDLLPELPEEERAAVDRLIAGREWKRWARAELQKSKMSKERARADVVAARYAEAVAARCSAWDQFTQDLQVRTDRVRFAAASSYLQAQLDPLLSKEERLECRKLRKAAITREGVRQILGCTATEYARWFEQGRLPLFRTRRVAADYGVHEVRTFLPQEIEPLRASVAAWREQHQIRKVAKRRGLVVVK